MKVHGLNASMTIGQQSGWVGKIVKLLLQSELAYVNAPPGRSLQCKRYSRQGKTTAVRTGVTILEHHD